MRTNNILLWPWFHVRYWVTPWVVNTWNVIWKLYLWKNFIFKLIASQREGATVITVHVVHINQNILNYETLSFWWKQPQALTSYTTTSLSDVIFREGCLIFCQSINFSKLKIADYGWIFFLFFHFEKSIHYKKILESVYFI